MTVVRARTWGEDPQFRLRANASHYILVIELKNRPLKISSHQAGAFEINRSSTDTQQPCTEKVSWVLLACLVGLRGNEDVCSIISQQALVGRRRQPAAFDVAGREKPHADDCEAQPANGFY
jgi:hypothetical protein